MNVIAIVQARMGSTRLPGKVLLDLAGEPVLVRDINRIKRARTLNKIVVATTLEALDNSIVDLCRERAWPFFRGSEHDVLDRYYGAAITHKADIVVRITADCPLIEPEIVDKTVNMLLCRQCGADYASNGLPPRTYPRGMDVEAFTLSTLERAWREDSNIAWREHVTPFIYSHPDIFRLANVTNSTDYSHMRWTLDTKEDLEFIRRIYSQFNNDHFTWKEVIALLDQNPSWMKINSHIEQKAI